MTAAEKIQKVSTKMLLAYPWWASLFLNMRRIETDRVSTMAVDGTYLYFNPAWTLKLSEAECLAVLMHETAHCALLHCFRRQWRHPLLWNIAADAAVNSLLQSDGLTLPIGCVPPAAPNMTAEEIYDKLDKSTQASQSQDVYGPGELGEEGQEQAQGQERMSEKDWKSVLASSRGMEPDGIKRQIDASTQAKRDWREELAEFMFATRRDDSHTWNRPSRRLSNMPGWKRAPEIKVAICIDTSGSVNASILSAFMAEAKAIANTVGATVYLISCDAAVTQVVEPGETWPDSLTGGGGTDFRPALTRAESLQVDAAVYFTDGQGTFPKHCQLPVLWALTMHTAVPFGKPINLN